MGEIKKKITVFYFRNKQIEVNALIDSGATDNFINFKTMQKLGIQKNMCSGQTKFYLGDGTEKQGWLTSFSIKRRNRFVTINAIAGDIEEDMVLGQPFLQNYHVKLNFKNDTFELGRYSPKFRVRSRL